SRNGACRPDCVRIGKRIRTRTLLRYDCRCAGISDAAVILFDLVRRAFERANYHFLGVNSFECLLVGHIVRHTEPSLLNELAKGLSSWRLPATIDLTSVANASVALGGAMTRIVKEPYCLRASNP